MESIESDFPYNEILYSNFYKQFKQFKNMKNDGTLNKSATHTHNKKQSDLNVVCS